ncbi:TetR/AcrR family transcriptional regulator [Rhodococcus ruber]
MVERIVTAGREVLFTHGYEGASTNRIAAAAGISPGSLYQYFPGKDAIVAEVVDRWTEEVQARISHVFTDALDAPTWTESVRTNMRVLLEALGENPRLLRVLVEQLPRTTDSRLVAFEHRIDALLAMWLRFNPGRRRIEHPDAIAWMLVRTVENVAVGYVLDQPPIEPEVVADQLTAMITAYLKEILD